MGHHGGGKGWGGGFFSAEDAVGQRRGRWRPVVFIMKRSSDERFGWRAVRADQSLRAVSGAANTQASTAYPMYE